MRYVHEKGLQVPIIGSQWKHWLTGCCYKVIEIANEYSSKPDYPVLVIYRGTNNLKWSIPLYNWYAKMIPTTPNHSTIIRSQQTMVANKTFTQGPFSVEVFRFQGCEPHIQIRSISGGNYSLDSMFDLLTILREFLTWAGGQSDCQNLVKDLEDVFTNSDRYKFLRDPDNWDDNIPNCSFNDLVTADLANFDAIVDEQMLAFNNRNTGVTQDD